MNKKLTAAFDAAKTESNATTEKDLRELAVPKFRQLYAAAQKAVRTVNRHIGPNKGTPNRATMATAIGLMKDFEDFATIGGLINEQSMTDAANAAFDAIEEIADMRTNGAYAHIDALPDYYTDEENAVRKADDAKFYLYNVTNAAIAAIDTINRHVNDGTFDPNTFKIAKVVGYADTLPKLGCDLLAFRTNAATAYLVTDDDKDAYECLDKAVADILAAKQNGFTREIPMLTPYTPSGLEDDDDDDDDNGAECPTPDTDGINDGEITNTDAE